MLLGIVTQDQVPHRAPLRPTSAQEDRGTGQPFDHLDPEIIRKPNANLDGVLGGERLGGLETLSTEST